MDDCGENLTFLLLKTNFFCFHLQINPICHMTPSAGLNTFPKLGPFWRQYLRKGKCYGIGSLTLLICKDHLILFSKLLQHSKRINILQHNHLNGFCPIMIATNKKLWLVFTVKTTLIEIISFRTFNHWQ